MSCLNERDNIHSLPLFLRNCRPMKKIVMLFMLLLSMNAMASNDLDLYDNQGDPVVYIARDDGMTIYSWKGEPDAWLKPGQNNEYHVYGFNGKHLGWFINGKVYDHNGYVACTVKENVTLPRLPPLKSLKSLKPLKSLQELPPLTPLLNNTFGQTDCASLMASGHS